MVMATGSCVDKFVLWHGLKPHILAYTVKADIGYQIMLQVTTSPGYADLNLCLDMQEAHIFLCL